MQHQHQCIRTEKLTWHQQLDHPCDEYLYKAGKAIKGLPTFKFVSSILDTCPTYIGVKQTKAQKQTIDAGKHINKGSDVPCEPHSTERAKHPYQGLSIDFSFC